MNAPPLVEDLEGIDLNLVRSLERLRNIDREGINADQFNDIIFENFTTISSDKRVIELVPDGGNTPVTFENRHQYCDLVLEYRLHEFNKQAAAIRDGLAMIVPAALLVNDFVI